MSILYYLYYMSILYYYTISTSTISLYYITMLNYYAKLLYYINLYYTKHGNFVLDFWRVYDSSDDDIRCRNEAVLIIGLINAYRKGKLPSKVIDGKWSFY